MLGLEQIFNCIKSEKLTMLEFLDEMDKREKAIRQDTLNMMDIQNVGRFLSIPISHYFLTRLEEYNSIFGQQQLETIYSTLVLMENKNSERIDTMVKTNDGFEIAEVDLKLRGPGDMAGTRQSGVEDLKVDRLGLIGTGRRIFPAQRLLTGSGSALYRW